jgi:lipoprotein-anchoring transpeptidase ErfK/SrfK
MRAILRCFVLAVVALGGSWPTSVGQEQQRIAVAASAGLALAEEATEELWRVLPIASRVLLQMGLTVSQAPLAATSRCLIDPCVPGEMSSQPVSTITEVGCRSCAGIPSDEQATAPLPRRVASSAKRGASSPVVGVGPALAAGTESQDAIASVREYLPRTGWVAQAGDQPDGPPMVPQSGRRLVTEAWRGGRYPLLVEDTNRYWLVDPTAGPPARPDETLAEDLAATSGDRGAVPARPVTVPGDVVPLSPSGRRLLVDQATQVMHVYEGEVEVRVLPVSTGMPTSKTLTRAWTGLVGHDLGAATVDGGMRVDQAWYLFPDLFGNILLHTVPYVQQGTLRIYDQPDALGVRPSSHGCVRISVQDALWLREWGPVGVPIEITAPPGPIRQAG